MMLHTIYQGSKPYGFIQENYFNIFPYISLRKTYDPRAGPFLTPGAWFEQTWWRLTRCCYKPNVMALCPVVSEKKIFSCFPNKSL